MKRLAGSLVIIMAGIFLFTGTVPAADKQEKKIKDWELGLAFGGRGIYIDESAVPQSVKDESKNPTITNPYNGRVFTKAEIGTYDPGDDLEFFTGNIFFQYRTPLDFPIKPYFRFTFDLTLEETTRDGSYGSGYTYEQVLGSGVDYVLYVYGMDLDFGWWVPEAGLSYVKDDDWTVALGASYQQLEISYYKGVESFGKPGHWEKIDSSKYDLWSTSLRFAYLGKYTTSSLSTSYTYGGKGINGWTAFFGIAVRF
jgi:hypothetical protein